MFFSCSRAIFFLTSIFNLFLLVRRSRPGIVAHRYFTGYGQERGGLSIEIHNNNWEQIDIMYMDTLPWYLKLYLHTFNLELNGEPFEDKHGGK